MHRFLLTALCAMSAAFVPTFTRHLTLKGKGEAWRLGNNTLNALILSTGVLVVLAFIFARPLITAFAGGFAQVPGKIELTVRLTRIVLPFLTLVAIGKTQGTNRYFAGVDEIRFTEIVAQAVAR